MRQSVAKKQLIAYRRAAGLCIQDGKPTTNGRSRCDECIADAKASRQRGRERSKMAGLCVNGNNHGPAVPGKTMCQPCIDKLAVATIERYETNKAAGKCRRCSRDPVPGHAFCAKHLLDNNKYAKARRDELKETGLCEECREPIDGDSKTHCEACRIERNKSSRANWRKLKLAAFAAYGGPVCFGCPENDVNILEIDHIAGGGRKHRSSLNTTNIYLHLAQTGYPLGYRVLCPTCNGLAFLGLPFPNQKKEEVTNGDV